MSSVGKMEYTRSDFEGALTVLGFWGRHCGCCLLGGSARAASSEQHIQDQRIWSSLMRMC